MMYNVKKHNNCINIPLSQTFRSYLHNRINITYNFVTNKHLLRNVIEDEGEENDKETNVILYLTYLKLSDKGQVSCSALLASPLCSPCE
jgi:hypothetical protein